MNTPLNPQLHKHIVSGTALIAKAEGWLNGCKRLLFSAYLQGKRDQIYWATKLEELTPIGKYRVMKQFLTWYSTVSNKHIHL